MAIRRSRIPKSVARKVSDLEDHLYLLREANSGLLADVAHVKTIAAELRVLACRSSGTEGLLWRLVDHYGVSDEVELHAAGAVDPDHPLARGLTFSLSIIQRPTPHLEPRLPSALHSFREIIQRYEAVWTLGMKSYTHDQLIRAVAEQMGSAHEDDGMEPGLSALEDVFLNGVAPYVPILRMDAELAIEIGERVLERAEAAGNYLRRRFSPTLTLSLHTRLREHPAGAVALATLTSANSGVTVAVSLGPRAVRFSVMKASRSWEIDAPLPDEWTAGRDAVFCLSYDHRQQRVWALSPRMNGESIEGCDLGFLDAGFTPQAHESAKPYVEMVAVYLHARTFSPEEVGQLHEILVEAPRIVRE